MREIYAVFLISLFAAAVSLSAVGCSVFRGAGEGVEAVGEGAGDAVAGTGRAISRAAERTRDEF